MNLETTIAVYAGGPGSGCRGENCGRPPKGTREVEANDRVSLLKPVAAWDERTWNKRTMPVGTRAEVVRVLPKVGDQPQMALLKFPGRALTTQEHIAVDDLFVVKKAEGPTIIPAKVKRGQVQQEFQTSDGARVTIMRPSGEPKVKDRQLAGRRHELRGRFKDMTGKDIMVAVDPYQKSRMFFAQRRGEEDRLRGTTVFVYRFTGPRKGMTVREAGAGEFGAGYRYLYEFRYKNIGVAQRMLAKRYGIKMKFT